MRCFPWLVFHFQISPNIHIIFISFSLQRSHHLLQKNKLTTVLSYISYGKLNFGSKAPVTYFESHRSRPFSVQILFKYQGFYDWRNSEVSKYSIRIFGAVSFKNEILICDQVFNQLSPLRASKSQTYERNPEWTSFILETALCDLSRVGIKKTTQINPPKKTTKNGFFVFFWVF